jgi:hypothetical protein
VKPVDHGYDPAESCNSQNLPLFKKVIVDWSTPKPLQRHGRIELNEEYLEPGYLYALVRNHGNSRTRDSIVYVGITNRLKRRFLNHPKVDEIRSIAGSCGLSIGRLDFGSYRTAATKSGNRRAIEELEHIFIWTLPDELWNERKQFTLPGMGQYGGRAWDITNTGHKFSGRMPRRIVYPWILIQPRRNRTVKR